MPKIKIKPVTRDFQLANIETEDGTPITVTVRQARTGDDIRIREMFAKRTYTYVGDMVQQQNHYNPLIVQRFMVYLTLVGCNMINDDDNPVFKFTTSSGRSMLDMPQDVFEFAWDELPTEISDEIYRCVLEMNPGWDPLAG